MKLSLAVLEVYRLLVDENNPQNSVKLVLASSTCRSVVWDIVA